MGNLFSIYILIISLMIGLLNSLKNLGADKKLIVPIQKVMVNGHISFFILMAVTYVISLFFWPTPAVPLICALLVPAAIKSGLPVMTAAMVIVIAGQGMALSSDYIIQVAPMLSATAAGIDTAPVADKAMILSVITGISALAVSYAMARKSISRGAESEEFIQNDIAFFEAQDELAATVEEEAMYNKRKETWGKAFAVLVPMSMLAVMVYMFQSKFSSGAGFEGTDGAAFVGGVATILLILATIAFNRIHALDKISDHITDGFVFAFRAMAPVIPIAGFFFMGNSEFTGTILSLGEDAAKPAFLFDMIQSAQTYIPQNEVIASFGILLVGLVTGLDGSGFSGLPLTGALSGAMASGVNLDTATMAAIGQMGAIWSGGTLVAWSSLVAVAGFLQISPIELARKNFIPVLTGLAIATAFAVLVW
ncbi:hypothetical protein [Domibacillus antri]|uniref:hypothetical protein n=1 Tax=Domibacillus antri TaxID=1714264 RepID=UPI000ACFB9AC|nr:hypothetical protein [Domibacillus antri]